MTVKVEMIWSEAKVCPNCHRSIPDLIKEMEETEEPRFCPQCGCEMAISILDVMRRRSPKNEG